MTLQELGIKDLEKVVIKTNTEMVLGDRVLDAGEPVLYFENIQISVLSEETRPIMAKGGWGNEPLVIWEDRNETTFSFQNGTFNHASFQLLLAARAMYKKDNICVPFSEEVMIGDDGAAILRHKPDLDKKYFFFVYDYENIQEKIIPTSIEENVAYFDSKYKNCMVMCDYYFFYNKEGVIYTMARERFSNSYTLEATFLMKDENDGKLHTGIITMPKVKIMSSINLRMGERANPSVATFNVIAMPEKKGDRESVICEIQYLDEDITGI